MTTDLTADDVRDAYVYCEGQHRGAGSDDFAAEFDAWLKSERARIWNEGYDANDAGPQRHNPYE